MKKAKTAIAFLSSLLALLLSRQVVLAVTVGDVIESYLGITFGETCSTEEIVGIICILTQSINYLFGIAGGVALLFLVVGGIQYMVSGGDEKALSSAKSTITYAVFGLVIIFAASFILNLVIATLF